MGLYQGWYDQFGRPAQPSAGATANTWSFTDGTIAHFESFDQWGDAMLYAAKVAATYGAKKPKVIKFAGRWRVCWRQVPITINSALLAE